MSENWGVSVLVVSFQLQDSSSLFRVGEGTTNIWREMVEKHRFFKKPRRESQRNELQRFKKVEDSAISFKLNVKKEIQNYIP